MQPVDPNSVHAYSGPAPEPPSLGSEEGSTTAQFNVGVRVDESIYNPPERGDPSGPPEDLVPIAEPESPQPVPPESVSTDLGATILQKLNDLQQQYERRLEEIDQDLREARERIDTIDSSC